MRTVFTSRPFFLQNVEKKTLQHVEKLKLQLAFAI